MKFAERCGGRYTLREFREIVAFAKRSRILCVDAWCTENGYKRIDNNCTVSKMFRYNPKTFLRTVAADKKRIARDSANRNRS